MITLFLDTASGPTGIAISKDGSILTESMLATAGKRQNGWLLPELERLLAACELEISAIDLFACTTGPGAFTGIRTGVATIQGLSLATNKPCIGVSSLALLAMNLPFASLPVCTLLDARKHEVYAGLYQVTALPESIITDQATPPESFLSLLSGPTIFLGDGALKYRDLIQATLPDQAIFAPSCHHTPRPACGVLLAEATFMYGTSPSPEKLLPTYLRLSEAELAKQQKA